jgi:hypothetical protein
VRELHGRSGVYLIKEGGRLVYVGESHSGRLLKTMVRHFQRWTRRDSWWAGRFGEGSTDPGRTYDRARSKVAFELTPPGRAFAREAELIARLRPRDNVVLEVDVPEGAAAAMEVPF